MTDKFQAVVIGGGPGGYVCAIRLAQLGLKTACIESRGSLGGTCLNVGCIPSKSLLNLSEEFHNAQSLSNKGIEIGEVKLNLSKMMKNKDKAVTILTKGVEFLLKKNKVTYYKGTGSFKSKNDIVIKDNDNKETIIQTENTQDNNLPNYINQKYPIVINKTLEKDSALSNLSIDVLQQLCKGKFALFNIQNEIPSNFF